MVIGPKKRRPPYTFEWAIDWAHYWATQHGRRLRVFRTERGKWIWEYVP